MYKLTNLTIAVITLSFAQFGWAEMLPPPNLAVSAYALKDFNSGKLIANYNKDKQVEPASLLKS